MARRDERRKEIVQNSMWQYRVSMFEKFSMDSRFPFLTLIEKIPQHRIFRSSLKSQLQWKRLFIRSRVPRVDNILHQDLIWSECLQCIHFYDLFLFLILELHLASKQRRSLHLMCQFSIVFMHFFHHPSQKSLAMHRASRNISMNSHLIHSASFNRNLKLKLLLIASSLFW